MMMGSRGKGEQRVLHTVPQCLSLAIAFSMYCIGCEDLT